MKPFFWIFLGSISGFLSVLIGAFGAHSLKSEIKRDLFSTFETGSRYQMYHALALISLGLIMNFIQSPLFNLSGWLFIIGTFLFSGSLYLLVFTGIKTFGAIAPLGGLCLMAAWIFFAIGACRG